MYISNADIYIDKDWMNVNNRSTSEMLLVWMMRWERAILLQKSNKHKGVSISCIKHWSRWGFFRTSETALEHRAESPALSGVASEPKHAVASLVDFSGERDSQWIKKKKPQQKTQSGSQRAPLSCDETFPSWCNSYRWPSVTQLHHHCPRVKVAGAAFPLIRHPSMCV